MTPSVSLSWLLALPLSLCACATAPAPAPTGVIAIAASSTPAELYLDDRFAGAASGRRIAVRPGVHRIEVRAVGMLPAYREVTVTARATTSVALPLRPDLDRDDTAQGSAR